MKKIFLLIIFTLSIYGEKINSNLPSIEKVQNIEPWWLSETNPVEGMIGGIGIAVKKEKNARSIAMEAARREIVASKQTYIEADFKLKQESNGKTSAKLESQQTIKGEVKALLIDTWEDDKKFYVWMAEFLDKESMNKLALYINAKNKETIENKIQIAKYAGRIVVTNKESGKITLNAGENKNIKKGEVYNVYRLKSESVNPLSNEVEDFSRKKIGEIVIIDVLDRSSIAQASFIDNFKIDIGDVVYPTGVTFKEKKQKKISEREAKMKKYDYDLEYIPKLLYVEKAKSLSTRQYSVSAYTDFDNYTLEAKMGFLKFFEASLIGTDDNDNEIQFFGKVGIPITEELYAGIGYDSTISESKDYIVTLIDYLFMEKKGIASFNYKYPVESNPNKGIIGASIQSQINPSVVLGIELGKTLESSSNNYLTLKGNLEIMNEVWLGGGLTWKDHDRVYFIKIEHLNII